MLDITKYRAAWKAEFEREWSGTDKQLSEIIAECAVEPTSSRQQYIAIRHKMIDVVVYNMVTAPGVAERAAKWLKDNPDGFI